MMEPIWLANAEEGLFRASLSADWDGYLCWLEFAAERINAYIDIHLINGHDAATHKAILRRYRHAAEHVADFRLLRPPLGALANIVRAYTRVAGMT